MRSLPRGSGPRQDMYVSPWGKSLRLSPREKPGAIRLNGDERIRVLNPLLSQATQLQIWADDETGVSPHLYRGFSGEGQVLEQLACENWQEILPKVRAHLNWQNEIDMTQLVRQIDCNVQTAQAALAALGARGLAEFDLTSGCYFHRELPFDLEKVEQLQPRLKNARKLLESKRVAMTKQTTEGSYEFDVAGTDIVHFVRLSPQQDKCTCPWFNKHQSTRGPCKHILATRLYLEQQEDSPS